MLTTGDRLFGIATFITLLVATIFFLISFSCPYWMSASRSNGTVVTHAGLWKTCAKLAGQSSNCTSLVGGSGVPAYMKAAQGLETLALMALLAALLIFLLCLVLPHVMDQEEFDDGHWYHAIIAHMVLILLTVISCLAALIVYGASQKASELAFAYFLHLAPLPALLATLPVTFLDCWSVMEVLNED